MNENQFREFLNANNANLKNISIRTIRPDPFSSADGQEWMIWRKNYEEMVDLNGWDKQEHRERSKREALCKITGEAKRRILNLTSNGAGETLTAFLNRIQSHYLTPAASEQAKSEYDACVQLPNEDILTYQSRMRQIYIRAHPANAATLEDDSQLRRKFIMGLLNPVIKTYVFDQRPATYAAAGEHAMNKAATEATVGGAPVPGGQINHFGGMNFVNDGSSTPSTSQANKNLRRNGPAGSRNSGPSSAPLCWTCGQPGHLARECDRVDSNAMVDSIRRGRGRGRRGGGGRGAPRRGRGRGSAAGAGRGRRRILNIEGPEQQGDEYADIVDELARDIDEEYEEAGNY